MSEDKGGFIKHNSKHGDKRVDNDEATIESAEKIAENLDGYFTIDYREDGIYLVIVPHKGYGKKVEFKDVKAHIIDRNIENVDFYDLKEKIYESDIKNEVRIADPQKKQDAKLEIRISEDKMKIYATILPPRGMGKWLDYESLISWLKEKGIIYGIKSKTVENLSRRKKQDGYMLVAEGDKPVNGEDAKIKYNFNKDRKIAPTIMEDGMVDHKNLNLIENVTKGQLLAYKIPPQPGKAGKNVFGEKVEPRPGKDVKISGGRNVEISDDGMSCYAACDGQVVYIRNKIDVLPVFEVQGDVGTSTGNIDFLGSVIVKGNVRGGFRIKSEGDIEIYGAVEGAEIISNGNIVLHKGIQGMNKGVIKAKGDVVVRYVENSQISAEDNVIVGGAIMHSNVTAGGSVEVTGRRGLIVGGTVRAGEKIIAKIVGSSFATCTVLEVGVNPTLKQEYLDRKKEQEKTENDYRKTKQAINVLQKLEKVNKLPTNKKSTLLKLYNTMEHLKEQLELVKKDISAMEVEIMEADKGKVKVMEKIHPGVKIVIGNSVTKTKDELRNVMFYQLEGQVKIGSAV